MGQGPLKNTRKMCAVYGASCLVRLSFEQGGGVPPPFHPLLLVASGAIGTYRRSITQQTSGRSTADWNSHQWMKLDGQLDEFVKQ